MLNRSYPSLLYGSALVALLGACSFGYHLGVLNTCISTISSQFGVPEVSFSPIATGAMLIGAAVGSIGGGHVADVLGPKRAMKYNNVLLVLGALLCGAAWSPSSLCWGRLVAGLGSGAASLFVPRYVAEISPPNVRGALGALTQVFINVGILLSYLAGLPYEFIEHASIAVLGTQVAWWRVMMYLSLLPPLLQAVGTLSIPESPVWLAWTGAEEGAVQSTIALQGPAQAAEVGEERRPLLDEEAAAEAPREAVEGWSGLLKRRYRWIVSVTVGLPVFQQLSGINTVIFFSTSVFAAAGVSSPVAGTLAVGTVNLVFTFVASTLMDKSGRKTLVLTSHAGMAVCLAMMVACIVAGKNLPAVEQVASYVTFGAIMLYITFFALGAGPIPWLYIGEVMPDNIKGKAGALATSVNWLTNLAVGLTFPSMLAALGVGSYVLYAAFNLAAVAFFSAWMVETRQQSLAQIKAKMLLKDRGN